MGLQQGCREIFTALKLCHHVKKFGNHYARELFKPSKDLASLLVYNEAKFKVLGFRFLYVMLEVG